MNHVFIDEDINIVAGKEAERRLAERNDLPFLGAAGVSAVTDERWVLAQRAEKAHWMRLGISIQDDRNRQHLRSFQSFSVLEGRVFQHAIEIGCGPFTNLRLIGRACRIRQCTLLDPLIKSYLSHPYCYYDDRMLDLGATGLVARATRKLTPRGYRAVQRLLGRCIPVAALEETPLESYEPKAKFDLVVMINVLEHCFDASRIFDRLRAICAPGTVFVFMDRLYDAMPLAGELARLYDAAHPLKIDRTAVLDFLRTNFDEIFADVVPRHAQLASTPEQYSWEELFFIGSRKTPQPGGGG